MTERERCACGKLNRGTRRTAGAESIPGGNRRSDPPCSSSVAWPAAFALGFPFLKLEAQAGCTLAGETLPRAPGRGWKREGELRNHAQDVGKIPRKARTDLSTEPQP